MPTARNHQVKRWEEMNIDILLCIFQHLNVFQLSPVSQVCRSWRLAASDHSLRNTLDLRWLKFPFVETAVKPYIYINTQSQRMLTKIFLTAMALNDANLTCMIFHVNLYMNDSHLILLIQRCPHIKRLVLPASDRITKNRICQLVEGWPALESLTMPSIPYHSYFMDRIRISCRNFSQLKIMGTFEKDFAESIADNIPQLKVLSLRCCIITKEALLVVLDSMRKLQVLNISHCIMVDDDRPSSSLELAHSKIDNTIAKKASRILNFFHCSTDSCTTCLRMLEDEGYMQWWKYEEDFWSQEEVESLCLGEYRKSCDYSFLNQAPSD